MNKGEQLIPMNWEKKSERIGERLEKSATARTKGKQRHRAKTMKAKTTDDQTDKKKKENGASETVGRENAKSQP